MQEVYPPRLAQWPMELYRLYVKGERHVLATLPNYVPTILRNVETALETPSTCRLRSLSAPTLPPVLVARMEVLVCLKS